jgi:nucleoside-diphosphate-sugar epimerase
MDNPPVWFDCGLVQHGYGNVIHSKNILITGGYGCIGAETAKWLVRNSGATVIVCGRNSDPHRARRVFHDVDRSRFIFVQGDVTDQARLQQILVEQAVTDVVHLAALQTPDCDAHRDLGLQINLAGTQNLIEAMKTSSLSLDRYIFASSVAVYGPRSVYPPGRVPTLAEPQPVNVYGAWKLAGEQISRFFCAESGTATLCLRPGVLFGPGRDAGLTSSPTTAMKCVALGIPYEIPFRSRQDYLYAPDVGAAFGSAVIEPFDGYGVFTLPSRTVDTEQIVKSLHQAAEALGIAERFRITIGNSEVPFICDLEFDSFLAAFPSVPCTPLDLAVRQSLKNFTEQVERSWLTERDVDQTNASRT